MRTGPLPQDKINKSYYWPSSHQWAHLPADDEGKILGDRDSGRGGACKGSDLADKAGGPPEPPLSTGAASELFPESEAPQIESEKSSRVDGLPLLERMTTVSGVRVRAGREDAALSAPTPTPVAPRGDTDISSPLSPLGDRT